MLNRENIRKEFLKQMNEIAEERTNKYLNALQERRNAIVMEGAVSLSICLTVAMEKYKILQATGVTGKLHSMYFSFLYTGILVGEMRYRLDLYDENERSSETECSCNWNFNEFSKCLSEIQAVLEDEFRKRGKGWEYELDDIIYQIALKLRIAADDMISEIFMVLGTQKAWEYLGENNVKVFLGELFDDAKPIDLGTMEINI